MTLAPLVLLVVGGLLLDGPKQSSAAPGGGASPVGEITSITTVRNHGSDRLSLNGGVIVKLADAPQFAAETLATSPVKPVLFIDGHELAGVEPTANTVDRSGNGKIEFFVPRTSAVIDIWGVLITEQRAFESTLTIGVGFPDSIPITSDSGYLIVLVQRQWFFLASAVVVAIMSAFVYLAIGTDLLRDPGVKTWEGERRRSWSLARITTAVWTLSILAAWMELYVLRHTMDTITDPLIGLMGLTTGMTATSSVLDQRAGSEAQPSQGIVKDILREDGGSSFQRFQLMAWTFAAVVVFWRQVIMYFAMPDFPASVVLLIGISSVSYLGSKATAASDPARVASGGR